jgi:hypothetical protein
MKREMVFQSCWIKLKPVESWQLGSSWKFGLPTFVRPLATCLDCLERRGERAVRPFGGFELEGIKLVAEHALKFGPAGKTRREDHSLAAVQTSRYPVHCWPSPMVSALIPSGNFGSKRTGADQFSTASTNSAG